MKVHTTTLIVTIEQIIPDRGPLTDRGYAELSRSYMERPMRELPGAVYRSTVSIESYASTNKES